MASTSQSPPGAAPNGSGPFNPNPVLVESYFDNHVFKPNDGHDFEHYSTPAQPPLAPQPSVVSASLGVASPSAENPQDCNKGTIRVSVSPHGPRRVLQPDHDVPSPASCPLLADDIEHTKDIWKLCIIGYVVGKFPGHIALNNLISSV
jgi:hypothetical protein